MAGGVISAEVQLICCRSPIVRIVVGSAEQGDDDLSGLRRLASDLDVGKGHSARKLNRAVVPQKLLDRVGVERRIIN